jgi:hypothetical protein
MSLPLLVPQSITFDLNANPFLLSWQEWREALGSVWSVIKNLCSKEGNPSSPWPKKREPLKSIMENNNRFLRLLEKMPMRHPPHDCSLSELSRFGQPLKKIGLKKVGGNTQTIDYSSSGNHDGQRKGYSNFFFFLTSSLPCWDFLAFDALGCLGAF